MQVLCGAARQACSQAEHIICSSAAQHAASALHSKDLDCLCQLSTATMQLSSAICCDPAVARPLISAGTHTPALDEIKAAVKSLTSMWTACMDSLKQQQAMHGPAGDHTHAGSQHAWQCLIPSLATSLKCLLHMSITSAEFISNIGNGSQQTSIEMCNMSALNLSWANLTRLLVAVPDYMRPQVSRDLNTTCLALPACLEGDDPVLRPVWRRPIFVSGIVRCGGIGQKGRHGQLKYVLPAGCPAGVGSS